MFKMILVWNWSIPQFFFFFGFDCYLYYNNIPKTFLIYLDSIWAKKYLKSFFFSQIRISIFKHFSRRTKTPTSLCFTANLHITDSKVYIREMLCDFINASLLVSFCLYFAFILPLFCPCFPFNLVSSLLTTFWL